MYQGYLLGIGSNLCVEVNVSLIVQKLIDAFGMVTLSRFYKTVPVGMESTRQFINFCVFIRSSLEPHTCKDICVGIETELGRDRTDPSCKTLDRAADIDLLVQIDPHGAQVQIEVVPDYLVQPAVEVLAILAPNRTVLNANGQVRSLPVGNLLLGETPATIDRYDGARLIVVS